MLYTFPENDPNKRVIKSPDPTLKANWPKAPSKYVFIFDAINLAGTALCKADWTGKELAAVQWATSPRDNRIEARLPPARGGGARGSHSYGGLPSHNKPQLDFHVHDWVAEQRQPFWEENCRALERLGRAVEWLAQQCRDGELISFAREMRGGEVYPMMPSEWNVDAPLKEFVVTGGGRRSYYHMRSLRGPAECFVFFDRGNLQEVLAREPNAPLIVSEADLSRLSPYLRLAVHVAIKRGYFEPTKCDTKDVREAEVRDAWPAFIPNIAPVPSTVVQIAKLIKFPEAEAIEQGQRGALSRKSGSTLKA